MKWITLLIILSSCSTSKIETKHHHVEKIWSILENSSSKGWSTEQLIKELGTPKEKHTHSENKNVVSWFYFQEETDFQEWAFGIKDNTVIATLYDPKDPYRDEFTIEKIIKRWKSLNCIHKEEQVIRPHVIKKEKYISCDNGKRIVRYNMYNEVESISVKK